MTKPDMNSSFPYRGNDHSTSTTFLIRLRNHEDSAWEDFMDIYAPLIKYWCKKYRDQLSREERRDILQDVLQKVYLCIDSYKYQRKESCFRAWLRRITDNHVMDRFRKKKQNKDEAALHENMDELCSPALIPKNVDNEPPIDPEEEENELLIILRQIMKRIHGDFQEKSWDTFRLLVFADLDSTEVSQIMDMTGQAVRKIRSRIIQRIRGEFEMLGIDTKWLDDKLDP